MQTILLLLFITIMAIPAMSFSLGSLFSSRVPAAGYVRTKAYVEESPEIGFGFNKVPVMVRVPTIVFRRKKTLVTRPVAVSVCQGCSDGQVQMQVAQKPVSNSGPYPPIKGVRTGPYTSNVVFPENNYEQYGNDDYSQ